MSSDVEAGEAVAGVGRAGELPDLAVERVELRLGVGGGLVGGGDGGLLLLELDLGLVDLLGDDLELVAGVGDELGGLRRRWWSPGAAAALPGRAVDGQGGGGADEQTGAEPAESAGRAAGGSGLGTVQGRASVQREGSPRAAALRFFLCNRLPS